eukprot:TRINITY_DN45504_c0_g1_i1.p1 TRINITY_DN45504_c0_g1~~TRINITY_DN45504_c0_g1_i1.p1  ORF type:complete len:327 (-),score=62.96 TRINITY_DN45504_c0_g1_i1:273-1253(-)
MLRSLVGSEMCIRDRCNAVAPHRGALKAAVEQWRVKAAAGGNMVPWVWCAAVSYERQRASDSKNELRTKSMRAGAVEIWVRLQRTAQMKAGFERWVLQSELTLVGKAIQENSDRMLDEVHHRFEQAELAWGEESERSWQWAVHQIWLAEQAGRVQLLQRTVELWRCSNILWGFERWVFVLVLKKVISSQRGRESPAPAFGRNRPGVDTPVLRTASVLRSFQNEVKGPCRSGLPDVSEDLVEDNSRMTSNPREFNIRNANSEFRVHSIGGLQAARGGSKAGLGTNRELGELAADISELVWSSWQWAGIAISVVCAACLFNGVKQILS